MLKKESKLLKKDESRFFTEPYIVTTVKSSLITAKLLNGDRTITRNISFFKLYPHQEHFKQKKPTEFTPVKQKESFSQLFLQLPPDLPTPAIPPPVPVGNQEEDDQQRPHQRASSVPRDSGRNLRAQVDPNNIIEGPRTRRRRASSER